MHDQEDLERQGRPNEIGAGIATAAQEELVAEEDRQQEAEVP